MSTARAPLAISMAGRARPARRTASRIHPSLVDHKLWINYSDVSTRYCGPTVRDAQATSAPSWPGDDLSQAGLTPATAASRLVAGPANTKMFSSGPACRESDLYGTPLAPIPLCKASRRSAGHPRRMRDTARRAGMLITRQDAQTAGVPPQLPRRPQRRPAISPRHQIAPR
jgi:hypothetical protein